LLTHPKPIASRFAGALGPVQAGIAVVTNARAAGQRSMLGYGRLLLEAARSVDSSSVALSPASNLTDRMPDWALQSTVGRRVRDIERFVLTPLSLAGSSAGICHVADPGNATYLSVIRHRASVVTVHDLIPYLCLAGRLPGFRPSRAGRWLMGRILARLKKADRIVCVSERTRRDLLELTGLDAPRVLTIPNTVFQPMAPAAPEECAALRAGLGLPAGAAVVLHVGQAFYKNHKAVLEVFARIRAARRNARLVLVGGLAPDQAGLAARLGLLPHVHVVPYIAPASMASLYTASSLLLFPSLYEGFGYPVLEAQLCGTPVVCSSAGALPEVAGAGARLFAPGDIAGMAQAALELLDDARAAAALAARGRANAARFSRATWFAAHAALYASLGAGQIRACPSIAV
jgi:glycosyltransferase involved in cell wall biosynthesis